MTRTQRLFFVTSQLWGYEKVKAAESAGCFKFYSEIVLMEEIRLTKVDSISYLHGFIHPRWLFGNSFINSSTEICKQRNCTLGS